MLASIQEDKKRKLLRKKELLDTTDMDIRVVSKNAPQSVFATELITRPVTTQEIMGQGSQREQSAVRQMQKTNVSRHRDSQSSTELIEERVETPKLLTTRQQKLKVNLYRKSRKLVDAFVSESD